MRVYAQTLLFKKFLAPAQLSACVEARSGAGLGRYQAAVLLAAAILAPPAALGVTAPSPGSKPPVMSMTPAAHREASPLKFSKACESGDSVTISAVGDFLFHGNLQAQAAREPNQP